VTERRKPGEEVNGVEMSRRGDGKTYQLLGGLYSPSSRRVLEYSPN
jgi:hypothetical protein